MVFLMSSAKISSLSLFRCTCAYAEQLKHQQQVTNSIEQQRQQLQHDLDHSNSQLAALQEQLEAAEASANQHRQAHEDGLRLISQLEQSQALADSELSKLRQVESELNSQLTVAESRCHDALADLAKMRQQAGLLERQLADAESEWRRADAELASVKLEFDDLEMQLAEAEDGQEVLVGAGCLMVTALCLCLHCYMSERCQRLVEVEVLVG